MAPHQVEQLLTELCVHPGFCLPPEAQARLKANPPGDPGEFTDAILRTGGLDPVAAISGALNFLADPAEDIYTMEDGEPFRDAL
jgi:hypothetical protein